MCKFQYDMLLKNLVLVADGREDVKNGKMLPSNEIHYLYYCLHYIVLALRILACISQGESERLSA